jgi:hypothetical protein
MSGPEFHCGLLSIRGIVLVTELAAGMRAGETGAMKLSPNPHYRHRFPAEIISGLVHGRFSDVGPMLRRAIGDGQRPKTFTTPDVYQPHFIPR